MFVLCVVNGLNENIECLKNYLYFFKLFFQSDWLLESHNPYIYIYTLTAAYR